MQIQLELPMMPVRLGFESPLSDKEFESLALTNNFIQLERSKDGELIVNAPAGGFTGDGNSEVIYQLRAWWKTHRRGRVFDSNCGFFLPSGASYSPDAAYATQEQLAGLSRGELEEFPRLCPAFVIELLSRSNSLKSTEAKMKEWITNGAQLGWLVDPYKKSVTLYEPDQKPRVTKDNMVSGTGPVAGLEFNAADVWSCYEL